MKMSEPDPEGMEKRMDKIRLKEMLEPENLTERELVALQIERNGLGCAACERLRQELGAVLEKLRREQEIRDEIPPELREQW